MKTKIIFLVIAMCRVIIPLAAQEANTPKTTGKALTYELTHSTAESGWDLVGLSNDQNYILSTRPNGLSSAKAGDPESLLMEVQYIDGFGRASEMISIGINVGSSSNTYNHTHLQEYDRINRPTKNWLRVATPYSADTGLSANRSYISPSELETKAREHYEDQNPYSETVYERTPLGRVIKEYGPGEDWQTKDKFLETEYISNATTYKTGNIRMYDTTYDHQTGTRTLINKGFYSANTLYVNRITNEDQHVGIEFYDKNGRLILSRQINEEVNHDTYYVYDDFGNLCYVLPPIAVDLLGSDLSEGNEVIRKYCYLYKYNSYNLCSGKRLPGAEWIYYIYDKSRRVIFSQDGVQRENGKDEWTYTFFDEFGRLVVTGLCSASTYTTQEYWDDQFCNVIYSGTNTPFKGYQVSRRTTSISLQNNQVLSANYYDNYDSRKLADLADTVLDFTPMNYEEGPSKRYGDDTASSIYNHKGLLTATLMGVMNEEEVLKYIPTVMYYDYRKQLIQTKTINHLKEVEEQQFTYNGWGQLISESKTYAQIGKTPKSELRTYTYNKAGNVQNVSGSMAGKNLTFVENQYDVLGRLASTKKNNSPYLVTSYEYNIRGWVDKIDAGIRFCQQLTYSPGGNITEMDWLVNGKTYNYGYSYDGLSRLTGAANPAGKEMPKRSTPYSRGYSAAYGATPYSSEDENYSVGYEYDKQGNILSLTRLGKISEEIPLYGVIDDLHMTYNGNQLIQVTDRGLTSDIAHSGDFKDYTRGTGEYRYNTNGALIKDSHKGILDIQYNSLNLPARMDIKSPIAEARNEYLYSASGNKLRVTQRWNPDYSTDPAPGTPVDENSLSEKKVTDYVGNRIYENGELKRVLIEGGYYNVEENKAYFYISDHLGNNRIVIDETGETIQVNHYYPFGMTFATGVDNDAQPYKYNGKELDNKHGLNLYDYSARYYEPAIGRFTTMDPLAEKYYSMSPYAYVANNPVGFVDPTGMDMDWFQNGDEVIWRPSKEKTITENGTTYDNIGSTVSVENEDGTFTNYYQNVGFRSDQPFNALTYIQENNLQGKYMSSSSGLWEQSKIDLMKATVHQGQSDFLNHSITQATINSVIFVATGGIEGIAGIAKLGKSLLGKTATKGSKKIFAGTKYSDKVVRQMSNPKDKAHAFPKSVDGYATEFGEISFQKGADGKTYQWLKMHGSYGRKAGTFEYVKDANGIINHRFLNSNIP